MQTQSSSSRIYTGHIGLGKGGRGDRSDMRHRVRVVWRGGLRG